MIKRRQVLFLLISVFLVVVAWVGFSIYHTYVTSTISQDLQTAIVPISPNFDVPALDKLKSRKSVVPIYQLQPSAAPIPTVAIQPSPPIATTPASLKGA